MLAKCNFSSLTLHFMFPCEVALGNLSPPTSRGLAHLATKGKRLEREAFKASLLNEHLEKFT